MRVSLQSSHQRLHAGMQIKIFIFIHFQLISIALNESRIILALTILTDIWYIFSHGLIYGCDIDKGGFGVINLGYYQREKVIIKKIAMMEEKDHFMLIREVKHMIQTASSFVVQ